MTLTELLKNEYLDFQEYCRNGEKEYPSDLTNADFVAFRVQYGVSRDYVNEIKHKINTPTEHLVNIVEKSIGESAMCAPVTNSSKIAEVTTTEQNVLDFGVLHDNECIQVVETAPIVTETNTTTYNLIEPLYLLFGVKNISAYSRISISAMRLGIKLETRLIDCGKKTAFDVLNCSISQLRQLVSSTGVDVLKKIKKIRDFISIDVDSIEMKLRQPNVPFYVLFDIDDLDYYQDISINSIEFTNRFQKALKYAEIKTVFSLLQCCMTDLQGWKSIDRVSVSDAVICLYEYCKNSIKKIVKVKATSKLNHNISLLIESEMNGEIVSTEELSDEELKIYSQLKDSISVCGEEFYLFVKNNVDYALILAESLRSFYEPIFKVAESERKLLKAFNMMPQELKGKRAKLLLVAYSIKNLLDRNILNELNDELTIAQLVSGVIKNNQDNHYETITSFLCWLTKIDLNEIAKAIFSRAALTISHKINDSIEDKYWVILEMRAEGETLESIGLLTDCTRERIRQIEKKFTNQFALRYQNNSYDLLLLIHALRSGDDVLTKDEVASLIGDKQTNLLWLVLSKSLLDCDMYRYSKEYDSVIFIAGNKNNHESICAAVNELPEFIHEDELDSFIGEVSSKHNVSSELVTVYMNNEYKKYGVMYARVQMTVAFMCQYVLKNKYPHGFKTGDVYEAKKFQAYLVEIFGDKKGKMTPRALDSKVAEVGVLCDRGKYIHPDYLQVEKWIIDEINAYIEENPKTVITYSELFDRFRSVLNGTQITNRFLLQGVLKHYGCKYKLAKDYITKEDGKNLTDEFEAFAKELGEFHKSDFFAAFPSMTDANLGMLTGRCRDVISIDYGYYMHSSLLHIENKDYDEIRTYLNNLCANGPVNSRYLYDEISYKFVDFISRNDVSTHTKLFGILTYMFRDDFVFSRPYISKESHEALTNKEVVLHYLEGVDEIAIEDVISMCQEKSVRYMSASYLIRQLSPSFVRINATTLMRYELIGIDDDIVLDTATYVSEQVKINKYCSVATINDFLWFPSINVEWTPYLVESIMQLAGDMISTINIPTTNIANLTSIFVGEEYDGDDYNTFILKILDDAFSNGFFTSKTEMKAYLIEKGLITSNKLPSFLENADYYYVDESGCLKRRSL